MEPLMHTVLCEQCHTLHRLPRLAPRQRAYCRCCGNLLLRYNPINTEGVFALSLAGLVVWLLLMGMPLVTLKVMGVSHTVTLPAALVTAWQQGAPLIAALSALCLLVIPALQLALLLWVSGFILRRRQPPAAAPITRLLYYLHPWGMIEVLFLGVLVAVFKLGGTFEVEPRVGLLALLLLMLLVTLLAAWDTRQLWRHLAIPAIAPPSTGALNGCHVCGQVVSAGRRHCPRCRAHLAAGPASLQTCTALLIAAIIFYFPANLLPVMSTQSFLFSADSTLLGGVVSLWQGGAWDLAIIVFSASVLVPVLKFMGLGLLLWRAHHPATVDTRAYAQLYRLIERLGYWSMLDVFVVIVLTGMVQLSPLAKISPLSGITWFALVVVLTMLASMSFDPKQLWKNNPSREPRYGG